MQEAHGRNGRLGQDRLTDLFVLGILELVADILAHESHITVDSLDPGLAAILGIDPTGICTVIDELAKSVPEVFLRIDRKFAHVFGYFHALGANFGPFFAVQDVVLSRLHIVGAHELGLNDVLDALDCRQKVGEFLLYAD